jgi:hypothetical protein
VAIGLGVVEQQRHHGRHDREVLHTVLLDRGKDLVGREPLEKHAAPSEDLPRDMGDHPEQVSHGQAQQRQGSLWKLDRVRAGDRVPPEVPMGELHALRTPGGPPRVHDHGHVAVVPIDDVELRRGPIHQLRPRGGPFGDRVPQDHEAGRIVELRGGLGHLVQE